LDNIVCRSGNVITNICNKYLNRSEEEKRRAIDDSVYKCIHMQNLKPTNVSMLTALNSGPGEEQQLDFQ
jgi:hypothetical protein